MMTTKNEKLTQNHSLFITQSNAEIKGISEVISFSDNEIVFSLPTKTLFLTGEGLSLDALNTENGSALVTGKVHAVRYKGGREKISFFKKLAK